jgi:hypothetical protein
MSNISGQIIQPHAQPVRYMITQQVVNGQLVTMQVPVSNMPQAQATMLQQAGTFPPTQMMQAQAQPVAMVQVRTANGGTMLIPQSRGPVLGQVPQLQPGMIDDGKAGAATVAAGASTSNTATVPAAADTKAKAPKNKFMQDLAKVAVGGLIKGAVSGALSN